MMSKVTYFPSVSSFLNHKQSATEELVIECKPCQTKFTSKEALTRHTQNIHYKIKHQCTLGEQLFWRILKPSICSKKFPAHPKHSRLDSKLSSNQVPVPRLPSFQIYSSLEKPFEMAENGGFSGCQKYLSVKENIFPNLK